MDSDFDNYTKKLQIKIGGMQCSFCTRTIKYALTRMTGVHDVAVSLAQEEVLVQYDPEFISPIKIQDTLNYL